MMDFPAIQLNERSLGVEIVMTRNRNAYARVRNGSVVISLPSRINKDSAYKIANDLYARIKKDILAKPEKYLYPDRNEEISLHDNETINIMGRSFNIYINQSERRTARGSINDNSIWIKIPESWDSAQKDKAVSRLARKVISNALKTDLEKRVNMFNSMYFSSNLKSIKLTNASTRWGSCTTTRWFKEARISLNFKLLFMPMECLDYVIVHELAHTKMHNHSKSFWKMVGEIIPDYKERIKLLKQSAYQLKMERAI